MTARQAWTTVLFGAMAVAAVGFGLAVRDDVSTMNGAAAEIREQMGVLEEVRVEKQQFADKLEEMAKSLRAESDSTRGSRGRAALDMSFLAAKEQAVIDQKQGRAEKRLAFQTERRDAAKKSVMKWGAGLAAVELALIAAIFVVVKRVGSGTAA